MIEIPLTQGRVAIIDRADADLAAFTWYAHKDYTCRSDGVTFYASRNLPRGSGQRGLILLHRVIAGRAGIAGNPDHVNRNGLDNRRENMRAATDSQSNANRRRQSNNTSGFKGVSLFCGRWRATICVNRKQRWLGYHATAIDAALVYDRAAREAFGEFACVNFPLGQSPVTRG